MINSTITMTTVVKEVLMLLVKEILPEEKELILKAAAAAPTAGNQQLYTILDITDQELKDKLAETCDHQPFIAKAKMVLIFCADYQKWYDAFQAVDCESRKPGPGELMLACSDANIAAQNAVTAAWSLGIGSCYIHDQTGFHADLTVSLSAEKCGTGIIKTDKGIRNGADVKINLRIVHNVSFNRAKHGP